MVSTKISMNRSNMTSNIFSLKIWIEQNNLACDIIATEIKVNKSDVIVKTQPLQSVDSQSSQGTPMFHKTVGPQLLLL